MDQLAIGVSLPAGAYPGQFGAGDDPLAALDEWKDFYGRYPASFSLWSSWKVAGPAPRGGEFPSTTLLQGLKDREVTPIIFWEPDLFNSNDEHNEQIIQGAYDEYLEQWAADAKAWGKYLIVRFAHEMNGNWFPWSPGQHFNTPATYVEMWKYVYKKVKTDTQNGNLKFLWCPNGASSPGRTFSETYPGDTYTQWVGLDTYDWTNTTAPIDVARGPQLSYLATLGKPILIAECGTASLLEATPRQVWLKQSAQGLLDLGVRGMVYFDINMEPINGQPDWGLRSTPGIGWVLKGMLALEKYQGKV